MAAAVILPRFRNLVAGDVSHKRHPRDLVTIADIEAERELSSGRRRWSSVAPSSARKRRSGRPEVPAALAGSQPVASRSGRRHRNFAAGSACFAVIVGFCAGGKILPALSSTC
ncbi:MAG: hypothetical protein U1E33_08835 [Rhodospirillales bacterium]